LKTAIAKEGDGLTAKAFARPLWRNLTAGAPLDFTTKIHLLGSNVMSLTRDPRAWRNATAVLLTTGIITLTAKAEPADPSTATADDGQIAEIIVTAQRRSEPLSKVPIAVTAIAPDDLQTTGVGTTIDLPRLVPGMAVGSSDAANVYFTPVLRGVGALTAALGNDNSVALYVDGIYQSDKVLSNIQLAGVSQIEVLKGPQGTLYGRNATGGSINVTTRGPTDRTEVEGEASYGNLGTWSARFFVGTPITSNLGVSVAYLHHEGGNFQNNLNPLYAGSFGGSNLDAFTGKVVWHANNFEAIWSTVYSYRHTTDLDALSPVPGTDPVGVQVGGTAGFARYTYTGEPNFAFVDFLQDSLSLTYSLLGFDIKSLSGFVQGHAHTGLDYDGTSADLFFFSNGLAIQDISQEFQFLTTNSGPLQATGGIYYYKGIPRAPGLTITQNLPYSEVNEPTFSNAGTVPAASVTRIDPRGTVTARAVYLQPTYAFTDATKLTVGLRYTAEDRDYQYTVGGAGGPGTGLPPSYVPFFTVDRPNIKYTKLTWRLALDHEFTNDILGYLSDSRGFKSGLYNMNDFTAPGTPGGYPSPVKPEVLDAYEVGIKSKFFDRKLQVDAALFYYNYKDLQVSSVVATTAAITELQNAASAHIYGLDGDVTWRATSDITLRANWAYLHARFQDFENAAGNLIAADGVPYAASINASGTQMLGAPTFSYTAGGDYTVHTGASKLVLTGSYYHTSAFKTVVGEGNVVDAYGRADAAMSWFAPSEKYYVRVYGQNLTNVEQIGTSTTPFVLARTEVEPRTYGVATGFKF
jgi:iron complex outermembrane recepter protein